MFNNKILSQMKRKIVNGLLLMAFVVSSVSSFVACKDYDEDVYSEVKGRLSKEITLREALQQQVNELEALMKTFKSCECDMSKYLTKEEANLDQYLKKLDAAKYLTKEEAAAMFAQQSEVAEYAKRIAALEAAIKTLQEAIQTINLKLIQVDTNTAEIAKLAGQVSTMNSTLLAVKATAEEALELAKKGGVSEDAFKALEDRVKDLEGLVAGWNDKLTEVSQKAEEALANTEANAKLIDANKAKIDSLKKILSNIDTTKITVNLTELEERLKAVEDDYVTNGQLDSLRNELMVASEQAKLLAQLAMDLAIADSIRINNIDCIDCLISRIVDLENYVYSLTPGTPGTGYNLSTDPLYIALKGDVTNLETALGTYDSDDFDDMDDRIGDVELALDTLIGQNVFKNAISKLNKRVDSLAEVTKAIEQDVEKLKQDLDNMITGVIINGTYSPVIGYFNAPLDGRLNLLAVYHGKPDNADWQFPSDAPGDYVKDEFNKWTPRNIQIIGALSEIEGHIDASTEGETLISTTDGIKGNAGTLYLTVNPDNVDFTGKTLQLLTSQGKASPATLTPLKASDKELHFGYTRAVKNGFYQTTAVITDVEKAKLHIDYNALKNDVKALINERSKSSLLDFGKTILENVQDVLPAYAVKASWYDKSNAKTHNVYSQYGLATTAVKPLSFAFSLPYKTTMPGIDRVQNLVGELVNKLAKSIDLDLPDFSKYEKGITFTKVGYPSVDASKLEIHFKQTIKSSDLVHEGKLYEDDADVDLYFLVTNKKNGKYALVSTDDSGTAQTLLIYDEKQGKFVPATDDEFATWGAIDFEYTVQYDNTDLGPELVSEIHQIIDNLNAQYGPGSDLEKTFADLLTDVASIGDLDTKIDNAIKDDLKNTINGYISKIDKKLTKWYNRASNILDLTMMGAEGSNIGMLSMAKKKPTKVKGSIEIVPTSYSLELLAPAYKKFVAVTDVFDGTGAGLPVATAKSLATAANGANMGKVVDSDKICTLNAGTSGYIYEITYAAVDYFGKSSIRKYYVKF